MSQSDPQQSAVSGNSILTFHKNWKIKWVELHETFYLLSNPQYLLRVGQAVLSSAAGHGGTSAQRWHSGTGLSLEMTGPLQPHIHGDSAGDGIVSAGAAVPHKGASSQLLSVKMTDSDILWQSKGWSQTHLLVPRDEPKGNEQELPHDNRGENSDIRRLCLLFSNSKTIQRTLAPCGRSWAVGRAPGLHCGIQDVSPGPIVCPATLCLCLLTVDMVWHIISAHVCPLGSPLKPHLSTNLLLRCGQTKAGTSKNFLFSVKIKHDYSVTRNGVHTSKCQIGGDFCIAPLLNQRWGAAALLQTSSVLSSAAPCTKQQPPPWTVGAGGGGYCLQSWWVECGVLAGAQRTSA